MDTPTPSPAAPAFNFDDVLKGLSAGERARAANDAGFAQTLLDRHADYSRRSAGGENPLDPDAPGDRGLWQWQNRMADKPGVLASIAHGATSVFKDVASTLDEVGDIIGEAIGDDVVGSGNGSASKHAIQRTADLAVVASSKALATNNAVVRGAGQLAEKAALGLGSSPSLGRTFFGPVLMAHPALSKVLDQAAADSEGRAQLEDLYSQHAFENARANYRDEKTAEEMHQRLAVIDPSLRAIIGNTEVNQPAASTLSMVPQMGVEAAVAKGVAVAGYGVASAQVRSAVEALATKRAELAVLNCAESAALSIGSKEEIAAAQAAVKAATDDIALRSAKLAELSGKAEAEVAGMVDAAATRVAAGKAAQAAGGVVSKVGNLAEALEQLPADLAAKIAPDSEVVRGVVEKGLRVGGAAAAGAAVGAALDSPGTGAVVGGIIGGKGLGGLGARAVVNVGRDLSRVGEIFAKGEATLPFWQNVRKARDISGFTRQMGAFMDNSVFAAGTKLGAGAARGALAAGAVGAGLGVLTSPDDPVSGAAAGLGSGALFGAGVGALGQWRSYANAAQVIRERAGQTRVYRDLLAARPDELKHFDTLEPRTQEAFAQYFAAHPDLRVRYINDASAAAGSYDGRALPDYITVNVASKDPLADIVGHEVSHYIENHELGAAVVKQAIGDAAAGIPGDYTLRDAGGNPIKSTDGTRFETNDEFNARRDAYVERIKATAQRAGWSPTQTAAEIARVSDPAYIAREIFAEQHLAYLNSPQYARDLKGLHAPSDWINNPAFLKNALAKFGVVFKGDEIVRSGILGDFVKSGTFDGLMRDYYRRQAESKAGDVEFIGGNTSVDEAALSKSTGYVERYFDASGEILRDGEGRPVYDASGKAAIRPQAAADRDARGAAEAAVKQLDSVAGVSKDSRPGDPDIKVSGNAGTPDVVQRRTTVDGRTAYAGRYLSPETLAAIEKSGKLNPVQLDNLRQLNGELQTGLGQEWTHFYQAATKKGGGPRARSLAGRWRTDLIYGIEITNPGNILFKSISLEVLGENAARAVAKGEATLWNNSVGDLLADVKTYLRNAADGKPGDSGLGVEKKNFINNLLGLRIKAHGDVNPLYETTNQPKTIITSLRLDRINRLAPVAERNVPFTTDTYQRVVRNLRPDEDQPEDSQLEGFHADLGEKLAAKMAASPRSDYEKGDILFTPSGTQVTFITDLLSKRGGADDGAARAYVQLPDGSESAILLSKLSPERPRLREEDSPQFRPDANEETQKVAASYVQRVFGRDYVAHSTYDESPEPQIRKIADYFETEATHAPDDKAVQASYQALADETLAQYREMEAAGVKIEPFTGNGEPYKSSEDMMKDVRENKHLSFFLTDNGFGTGESKGNPLLQPSGVKIGDRELLFNDLFRAVHDYFGHTQQGFQFGPRGEFNAWKSHSRMFSDEAQGALAAETLAQNAWVNFGPHLRDADGKIAKRGEPGYVAPQDRPFAEQKNFVLPEELRAQLRPDAINTSPDSPDSGASGIQEAVKRLDAEEKARLVEAMKFVLRQRETDAGGADAWDRGEAAAKRVRTVKDIIRLHGEDGLRAAATAAGLQELTQSGVDETPREAQDSGNGDGRELVREKRAPLREGEKLPHAVRAKTLDLVHYSDRQDLKVVDPKFLGKGKATQNDLKGLPGSFWFLAGSPLEADANIVAAPGTPRYGAKVSGARVYDSSYAADDLGYWQIPNREKADQMLIDAGYAGWYVTTTDGRKVVKMFEPVPVERRGKSVGETSAPKKSRKVSFEYDAEGKFKSAKLVDDEE